MCGEHREFHGHLLCDHRRRHSYHGGRTQVKAITETFTADWDAAPGALGKAVDAPGLVWSPNAATALVQQITSAKHSVQFSSEELADPRIIDALGGDAKRGVTCQIVMTADSWDSAFTILKTDGCQIRTYKNSSKVLYIHEKQIIVDDTSVLLGSQNASATSLNKNRELSILTTNQTIVKDTETEFTKVFNGGTSY